ncbi:hypothetical protein NECAME_04992 [Necator americanus]|uniref:Uncharacterized protein n=1 Tax=Necator americanus TaxID=51031 RepID=W2SMT4_NECAM|nr:hypothetical protein NECAME_04992 [Necator americanus]ETN70171.1 hypothetical protein NECAME_04992 [Necator americanus]
MCSSFHAELISARKMDSKNLITSTHTVPNSKKNVLERANVKKYAVITDPSSDDRVSILFYLQILRRRLIVFCSRLSLEKIGIGVEILDNLSELSKIVYNKTAREAYVQPIQPSNSYVDFELMKRGSYNFGSLIPNAVAMDTKDCSRCSEPGPPGHIGSPGRSERPEKSGTLRMPGLPGRPSPAT